jgi:UDP-N-acetylmuramate dehydrogenase
MNILENISLKPFNSFGLDKKARFFVSVKDINELKSALRWANDQDIKVILLGGGTNILLTKDLDALVIKIELSSIKLIKEDDQHLWVEVGSGENWHEFVMTAIKNNWSGIENLSLIPGTVGASPMQNIGAYGVEIKDVFSSLQALNRETLEIRTFSAEECGFGYRESIFKTHLKDKYVIISVVFKLYKIPVFHLNYGAIQETLNLNSRKDITIKKISDAVILIRQSKLPDPKEIGNSGSFFKNPIIETSVHERLKSTYPTLPGYVDSKGIKVPAAWLIEQCGWKGKRFGEIGVHDKQPLVLVNYGNGDGKAIQELAQNIIHSVKNKFGIELEAEVNFL